MKTAVLLVALLAVAGQALGARRLKEAAGTPQELATEHPEVAKVLSVIAALGVLPSGQLDAGLTSTLPTNEGVDKLLKGLGLTLPEDPSGIDAFLAKLGPIKDILTTAILHNISPGTPAMPADGSSITLDTLGDSTVEISSADGKLTAKSPGNALPVPVKESFDWNGAQIVVVDDVLTPKSPLTSIAPTTAEAAKAKIAALLATLGPLAGSPEGAPAMAPGPMDGLMMEAMMDLDGDGMVETSYGNKGDGGK